MFGRRMLERSAKLGRDRTPGFTPMRNKRIDDAVNTQIAVIQLAEIADNGRPLPGDEATAKAWQNVARTLPAPRMVARYRVTPNRWNADGSRVGGYPGNRMAFATGDADFLKDDTGGRRFAVLP
jgi:hypothetical protein